MKAIYNAIQEDLSPGQNHTLSRITVGSHLVMAVSRHAGLASHLSNHDSADVTSQKVAIPDSAKELAAWLGSPDHDCPLEQSLALAAANSLLSAPDEASDIKAQELIRHHGKGKNVVVVGHFPFVERMGSEFASFNVLELNPGEGDLPAASAGDVVPHADVLAITATTIVNGTLETFLQQKAKTCFTILLGPSTPFSPSLFNCGVDALCGSTVTDAQRCREEVETGFAYRRMKSCTAKVMLREKSLKKTVDRSGTSR